MNAPIRRRLASQLQYPHCAYFAGLTPANKAVANALLRSKPDCEDKPLYHSGIDSEGLNVGQPAEATKWLKQAIPPGQQRVAKRLIARNATRLWRGLLAQGTWEKQDVDWLLNHESRFDVFDALDAIASDAADADATLIDAETRFVVDFYQSLRGRDLGTQNRMPIPESLQGLLLSNGANFSTCYAIRLGRAIATSQARLATPLHELFEHRECNLNFAKQVLLFGRGWDGCETLTDAEWKAGLLRTLFLLALVASKPTSSTEAEQRWTIGAGKVEKALKAPKQATASLEDAMRRLQERAVQAHQLDYPFAFTHALARAGVKELPGWPAACQPLGR